LLGSSYATIVGTEVIESCSFDFGDLVVVDGEITCILSAIEQGDQQAAEQLLPLVYDALRQLAAQRLTHESPGQTLQATALVHEVYLRLVDTDKVQHWQNRGHFFGAAAEAMRRILIERARSKQSHKRGGQRKRIELEAFALAEADLSVADEHSDELLALDDALAELESHDRRAADLVKLRYFAGLTHQQAAEALGISRGAADRLWVLSRTWLRRRILEG
jgi:RNA polymerase sigma factor (TIGR02999 family)